MAGSQGKQPTAKKASPGPRRRELTVDVVEGEGELHVESFVEHLLRIACRISGTEYVPPPPGDDSQSDA